jgi:hypothetical protein
MTATTTWFELSRSKAASLPSMADVAAASSTPAKSLTRAAGFAGIANDAAE